MEKENYTQLLRRLSKVEGQVRGIKSMIESDRNTTDILAQLSAVKSGTNQVAIELIFERISTYPSLSKAEREELKKAFSKFI